MSCAALIRLLAEERCSMAEIIAATGRCPKFIRAVVDTKDVPAMKRIAWQKAGDRNCEP